MTASICSAVPQPIRKLWEPDLVEHVAFYADQHGDTDLESLCNKVLAGKADEEDVFSAIREDSALADWCAPDQRYRTRGAK